MIVETSVCFTNFSCYDANKTKNYLFHNSFSLNAHKLSVFDSFQADVDGNGTIDYIEFITATMHLNRMEREDHLYKAFEYFDEDKSGLVSSLSNFTNHVILYIHALRLFSLSLFLVINLLNVSGLSQWKNWNMP